MAEINFLVNPQDVLFVVENSDGTSTLGVSKGIHPRTKKQVIERQIVTRKQGNQMALALEKRDKANGTYKNPRS